MPAKTSGASKDAPRRDLTDPFDLANLALEAFYVTVGLGVIAVQNLESQRQQLAVRLDEGWERFNEEVAARTARLREIDLPTFELPDLDLPSFELPNIELPAFRSFDKDAVSSALDSLTEQFEQRTQQLDERMTDLEARVDEVLDRFSETLPEPAREVMSQAREAAKEARGQLRTLVTRAA